MPGYKMAKKKMSREVFSNRTGMGYVHEHKEGKCSKVGLLTTCFWYQLQVPNTHLIFH